MYVIKCAWLAVKIRFLSLFYRNEGWEIDKVKARIKGDKNHLLALYVYLYQEDIKGTRHGSSVLYAKEIERYEDWMRGHKLELKNKRQMEKESLKRIRRNNMWHFFTRAR